MEYLRWRMAELRAGELCPFFTEYDNMDRDAVQLNYKKYSIDEVVPRDNPFFKFKQQRQ